MPKFQGFTSRADKNGVQEAGSSNLLTQTEEVVAKPLLFLSFSDSPDVFDIEYDQISYIVCMKWICWLSRLATGELDGPVGDIREYGIHKTIYCGKYIKAGIPTFFREGASERFFNGKEEEKIPGKRTEERYETDDRKLEFLQRYGFLMDDTTTVSVLYHETADPELSFPRT